jgi:hypothetical protein
MFERLKRHPFDVVAHFRDVLVLTYAFPAELLRPLLPIGLDLDTFDDAGDEVGFVAIALVRVERMRPAFVPRWLGQGFVLVGFRVFARFRDAAGKTRRGLRILESRTDRRLMAGMGNLLTHYNYKRADISWRRQDGTLDVRLAEPGGGVTLDVTAHLEGEVPLPGSSPFVDWQQARRYAGPLPWTFDYDAARHAIVMIKGEREGWTPRSVAAEVHTNRFFERAPFAGHSPTLASIFHLENIDYCWRRGIFSPLAQTAA